jgi:dTDP-4-dehydrorhamnose 3,5-epimerase
MEQPYLIENKVFEDNRGVFAPLPLNYDNSDNLELKKSWIQSNVSFNPNQYTLRGLHFQMGDKSQSKLIKVITGGIIDFIIDIRSESSDYMKLYVYNIKPNDELFVPKGFAHGFITTEPNTIVQYLVDNDYSPESEGSIYWKEVDELRVLIGEYESDMTISEKDLYTKNFKK